MRNVAARSDAYAGVGAPTESRIGRPAGWRSLDPWPNMPRIVLTEADQSNAPIEFLIGSNLAARGEPRGTGLVHWPTMAFTGFDRVNARRAQRRASQPPRWSGFTRARPAPPLCPAPAAAPLPRCGPFLGCLGVAWVAGVLSTPILTSSPSLGLHCCHRKLAVVGAG